jgi:RNA polymerase-binding transcription factor DksA
MAKKLLKPTVRGTKSTAKPSAAKKSKATAKKAAVVRTPMPAVKKVVLTKAEEKRLLGPKNFSDADLKRFKQLILAKRQETLEELDTLKESSMDITTGEYISESSNYSLHMEQGTDAMEREKTFLFMSRESKFLIQLDDALARIEDRTYGQCKVCSLLIPKERLEAVPTATTCAEYKNTNIPCERGRLVLGQKRAANK